MCTNVNVWSLNVLNSLNVFVFVFFKAGLPYLTRRDVEMEEEVEVEVVRV